jgi:hypothetical protein
MIRKAFDERMEPLPDGTFERGKIVSSNNSSTTKTTFATSTSTQQQHVPVDELEESVERIHELTEQMSKLADELAASKSKLYLDERIEMAKNAIYTIPREYREPVAPVVDDSTTENTKKRFRFWPWRKFSKKRRLQ